MNGDGEDRIERMKERKEGRIFTSSDLTLG